MRNSVGLRFRKRVLGVLGSQGLVAVIKVTPVTFRNPVTTEYTFSVLLPLWPAIWEFPKIGDPNIVP